MEKYLVAQLPYCDELLFNYFRGSESWNEKINFICENLKYDDLVYLKKKIRFLIKLIPNNNKKITKKDKFNFLLFFGYDFYEKSVFHDADDRNIGVLPPIYENIYDRIRNHIKKIENRI